MACLVSNFFMKPYPQRGFCCALQIVLEKLLQAGGVGLLAAALQGDGDSLPLLDAQAHQGHQLGAPGGLAVGFGDGDGAVQGLDGLDQQPGGAGVDAHGIGDGVGELFHDKSALSVENLC